MNQKLAHVTLLVNDYDEAIDFYIKKIGFDLVEDISLDESKRWVLIAPKGNHETCLLLAKASGSKQKKYIGNQTGGRVFLFLHTDNFWRDYERMQSVGVVFIREPLTEPYGIVAVFKDLYGNMWDLIEPKK